MTHVVDALIGGFTRRQTLRDLLYTVAAFPIGVLTFTVAVALLSVGASLAILVIGILIMAATLLLAAWAGRWEVRFANRLLGAGIDPAPAPRPGRTFVQGVKEAFASGYAWKAIIWSLLRLPLGIISLLVLTVPPMVAWVLLVAPIAGTLYDAAPLMRGLALAGGVSAILLIPHLLRGIALMHAGAARGLLGRSSKERLEEAAERTAVAEARTGLARDLHDSVGHSVTASVLQASAARKMLRTDPDYADQALAAIEQQGRLALEELDRVLAVMRDDGAAERSVTDLGGLDTLFASAKAAGQPVEVMRTGNLGAVPNVPSQVAFRVVQEGITNAMRHAAGAPTHVVISAGQDAVDVEITNGAGTSISPGRTSGGNGITGVRERVEAVGGTVEAAPHEGDGFRLAAHIPYRPW